MNIFEMARENSGNLKQNYCLLEDKYINRNDLDILRKFTEFIKDNCNVSINMKPFVLNSFLLTGTYMNVYELKKEGKKQLKGMVKPEIPVEEAVKRHLKSYYISRTTFDRTFEDGEKFKYGALNTGGLGLRKHGKYCVVIKRNQTNEYQTLTFIKEDSLHYFDGNHVDVERLSRDMANRECVHLLAALKHDKDIQIFPEKWASLVCGDECYVEAVTKDDILKNHIESVRMTKEYYDFITELLYKEYLSEISEVERTWLYDFKHMQELLKKEGIKLEVIEE